MTDDELGAMSIDELISLSHRCMWEAQSRDVCEHGIVHGDWCEECNSQYKLARIESGDTPED